MGQVHNALAASRLGPAIRAALGIKDGVSTIERFSETLQPSIDLWALPEWARLRGELLWGWGDEITAVAGEFCQAYVVNPSNSGNLVVLEKFALWRTGGVDLTSLRIASEAQITALGLAADVQVVARDLRGSNSIGQKLGTTKIVYGTNAGITGTNVYRFGVNAGSSGAWSPVHEVSIVLPPGYGVGCAGQNPNQTLEFTFLGRERKALAGELES